MAGKSIGVGRASAGKLGHDPLHELVEKRHGKGCVAMSGAEDHSLQDQAISDLSHGNDPATEALCDVA